MNTIVDVEKLYASPPPPFGAGLKPYFKLDPDYVNFNNGSYGSAPIPVLQAADTVADRIEFNPDLFLKLEYLPLLTKAREEIAKLIGAKTDEVVFVPNTTTGDTTVLRNFEWEEGDVIIIANTTFLSVVNAAQYLSDTPPHPTLSTYPISFSNTHAGVLETFRKHIQSIPKVEGKKRVAVIDSIIACPGVLIPWQEMVKVCKEEGVYSIIDAAHSIGQEVELTLVKRNPIFGFLTAINGYMQSVLAQCSMSLKGTNTALLCFIINHIASQKPTPNQFPHSYGICLRLRCKSQETQLWTATIDYPPYITVPDALKFRAWLGGESMINTYCHELTVKGGKRLAELWGTSVMDPNSDLTLNMVNVELPFPSSIPYSWDIDISVESLIVLIKRVCARYTRNDWYGFTIIPFGYIPRSPNYDS